MSKQKEPVIEPKYDLDDLYIKPIFAPEKHLKPTRQRLFDNDAVKVEHSFGYQGLRGTNLEALATKTVMFAAGVHLITLDLKTNEQTILPTVFSRGVSRIAIHPTKKYFAVAEMTDYFCVRVFSYPTIEFLRILEDDALKQPCTLMEFHPKGNLLATVSDYPDNSISIWLWEKEKCVLTDIAAGNLRVYDLTFSCTTPNIFTTCGEYHVKFWKLDIQKSAYSIESRMERLEGKDCKGIYKCVHLPNNVFLAGTEYGYLLFWKDPLTEACLKGRIGRKEEEPCHKDRVNEIILAGDYVITLGSDGWMHLWSYKAIARRLRMMAEDTKFLEIEPLDEIFVNDKVSLRHGVPSLQQKAEKLWFVQDESCCIWQIDISMNRSNNPPKVVHRGPGLEISQMDSCKVYPFIAACSKNGLVIIFDANTNEELCFSSFSTAATSLFWTNTNFDPTGASLLVGFHDGTLRWLVITSNGDHRERIALRKVIKPHTADILCISFNANSTILATYGMDKVLFFMRATTSGLFPIGYYNIDHEVKWISWIKSQIVDATEEDDLEGGTENDTQHEIEDKADDISELKMRPITEREPVAAPEHVWEYVDENVAIPELPKEEGNILLSYKSDDTVSSEELSDSPKSSSGSSSPYEEEKLKPLGKRPRGIKETGEVEKKNDELLQRLEPVVACAEEVVDSARKAKFPKSPKRKIIKVKIKESLLLCCKSSYIIEVDPPDQSSLGQPKDRKTYLIKYENIQEYRLKVLKPYHELGDRVYDSEDDEHPNRSQLVKLYFKELKYAEKRASRRRRRRELGIKTTDIPAEILCWLPSDKLGHLWLSLGTQDNGYLFEFPFERSNNGQPVNLVPTRAVELLTSELTSIISLSMSPCGEFVFLGQEDGALSVCRLDKNFDISSGYDFVKFPLHDAHLGPINHTKVTPKGKFIVTAGGDGNIFLLSFNTPQYKSVTEEVAAERPIITKFIEVPDVEGNETLTVEEELQKHLRLRVMDKAHSILTALQDNLPLLKTQYKELKSRYKEFHEKSVPFRRFLDMKHSPVDIDMIACHPKCFSIFDKETKIYLSQISAEYKEPIAQWGSYYAKLRATFEDPLEFRKVSVKDFVSDEVLQNYLECELPKEFQRDSVTYNPLVYEYKEYKPEKHEYVENTAILSKLQSALRKAEQDLVRCPKGMPWSHSINEFNERKLGNIRRIKQLIHFEETNPIPKFEEDETFFKERKRIENSYFAIKSDIMEKNHLPKEMLYNPSEKKESIITYLNQTRRLWRPFNLQVQKIEKLENVIQRCNLGFGDKERVYHDRIHVKEVIELILDVVCLSEVMVQVVVEDVDFIPDESLIEQSPSGEADAKSDKELFSSLVKGPKKEYPLTSPGIFCSEFKDSERFYTGVKSSKKCGPLYFNPSQILSSKRNRPRRKGLNPESDNVEPRSTESGSGSSVLDYFDPGNEDADFETRSPSQMDSDHGMNFEGTNETKPGIKFFKINGMVVSVAELKTRTVKKKVLTENFSFSNEVLRSTEEGKERVGSETTVMDQPVFIHEDSIRMRYDILHGAYEEDEQISVYVHAFDGNKGHHSLLMSNEESSKDPLPLPDQAKVKKDREETQKCDCIIYGTLPCFPEKQSFASLPLLAPTKDKSESSEIPTEIDQCKSRHFLGIREMLEQDRRQQERKKKFKESQQELKQWRFFHNLHHVLTLFKSKIDCEKKYHDLVYNTKCRELNIIEETFPTMQKYYEQIKEQEKSINFECTKLEILRLVSNHAQKKLSGLKKKWDGIYVEFMERLSQVPKDVEFFTKFFSKTTAKSEQGTDKENKKESDSDEEGESKVDEVFAMEMSAKYEKIHPELFSEAKRKKDERDAIEQKMEMYKKRIIRCSNKKLLIMKKVKKSRSIISEIIPEMEKLKSSMKDKLNRQHMVALLSTRRIECKFIPRKAKQNITNLCKNLICQLEQVEEISRLALRQMENDVIISDLLQGKKLAIVIRSREADTEEDAKKLADAHSPSATGQKAEVKVEASIAKEKEKKEEESETKTTVATYKGCVPEQEKDVDIKVIVNSGISRYDNYSNLIEGNFFAYPDYFIHPITFSDQADVQVYQEVYECVMSITNWVVRELNKDVTTAVKNILSNIVQKVTTIQETCILDVRKDVDAELVKSSNDDEETRLNPGGGLLYDLDILHKMEKDDPCKYLYSSFFREYIEMEEVTEEAEESSESSEEEEQPTKEFTEINQDYIVISKGNMDKLKETRNVLEDTINKAILKRKREAMYLHKLQRINTWIKKVALRQAKFHIKDSMLAKLGRVLDLEALLDTMNNPLSQITKYKMEKKLKNLRKSAQFHHKIAMMQEEQKGKLVYENHLLWIHYAQIREEMDFWNNLYRNKKNVLPKISAQEGP